VGRRKGEGGKRGIKGVINRWGSEIALTSCWWYLEVETIGVN
jgi:hypothetical protein